VHNAQIWGWEIPVYLFLGGMAAGLMIIAGRAPRRESTAMRLLPLLAPVVLSIGMGALFLDLDFKLHVFRFYTSFQVTSPMSWGSWILLAIYPVTILEGLRGPRAEGRGQKLMLMLGVALGAYTGILLGTLSARPLWASLFLAPLFLVSGFSTAAAVTMFLPIDDEEREVIRRWDVTAIVAEVVLLAVLFIDLAADARGRAAVAQFFGGSMTAQFWALVVVLGLAAPLALEIAESRRHLRPTALTPTLLLIGGLALRWMFVAAGQM